MNDLDDRHRAGDAAPPPRRATAPALDRTDLDILERITADGRLPLTALAERLELSRSTVQVRLARLEAEGVIDGYTIRPGPNHPAGFGLRALVTVTADHRGLTKVSQAVARIPEVAEVLTVSGGADLVLDVRATAPSGLDRVLATVRAIDGVVQTGSSVVLATRAGPRPLSP